VPIVKHERRAALGRFFADFAASRRGVRSGSLFGRPALFAGRRAFACLGPDGLRCRLPAAEARRVWARAGRPDALLGVADGAWVVYGPPDNAALMRLEPILELAARATAGRGRADP
jgi:hypothetical protein